jgi:type IV pilus assembly protein PilQ
VRNRDIHYVFDLLNSTGRIKIVALPNVKGTITITLYDTTVEKALAAILKTHGYLSRADGDYTLVYSPGDLELLDPQSGKIEVYTYKPRYIAANDLIQVITPHLSDKGKISSTKANQVGIATNADNAGGDSLAVDDALVVQDIHTTIERVKRIIEEIDVRPQQVLIEAVLLSVLLDNDHHLGVNFALLHDNKQGHLAVSGNGAIINGAAGFTPASIVSGAGRVQGAAAANEHGFKYAVVNASVTAFVNLLETIGQTTVVASPKVLALNKQRAEIIVGSQLGYRTVTTTETAAVENVQFLDVGTQLRMRPFVQQDGRIRMELHPEKSSGRVSESTGLPEKDTTQVTTNLTVRSGETIVIGGLIEEQQQRSVQQIPFFGSLPVVGHLFRDETTTINRNEIIVLITPTIVDEEQEYERARCEVDRFTERRDSLEQSFPEYTRLALARRHFQNACDCRDAGDMEKALKLVEMSIYFDPTYEPALELRRMLHGAIAPHTALDANSSGSQPLLLYPVPPEPAPALR